MKLINRLLLFVFFSPLTLWAQSNFSVKGVVADSVEMAKLDNTSIAVLNAKDSTLVSFTYATGDGAFSIKGLHKGKFILLVSYPKYADYVERFSLDSLHQIYNFGHINMQLKERLLKEVIVKGTAVAIKVKGDTTEFNAAAYTVQPNAKVEDLLRQLPGIQVDKDGKITAQGETVSKVLVDGEEFFGDDPTLVTKNIRADMVDKVQLYDKKSDQAAFTGIDDGKKTKTINVKLKSDKKNGMFGKADAGDGPGGYYQAQGIFNTFSNKQKFSVYGTAGNNSRVGLGFEDNQKYGSGQDLQFGDDGGIMISLQQADDLDQFDGRYNGQGIPTARNGGMHYENKWNSDKESINSNYKVGSLNIDGVNNSQTQNNLPGDILNSTSGQEFHKYMFRQKLDATYQVKLDTTSNLKLAIDGTQRHSTTNDTYTSTELNNDTLINKSTRSVLNTIDQKALNASAFYTKKFRKKGRTLSATLTEGYSESKAKGFLNSDISFYNTKGNQDSAQLINQRKIANLINNTVTANVAWSEPLSKTFAVIVNFGINVNNSSADRQSFNQSSPGTYNVLVDSLSSNYRLNEFANQAGAIFNYKKGKHNLTFGTRISDVKFHQVDEVTGNILDRRFINWGPQASYQYHFAQQGVFIINYNGNTTQPTLDQIQPLRLNTDPLNIILGNPNLKPSFTNTFFINYRNYKVVSDQFTGFYGSYSITGNPIVTDVTTDPVSGKSISKYLNLPGRETVRTFFGGDLTKKLNKLDVNIGLTFNANGNTYYNLINDQLNKTESYTFNPGIVINEYKAKKFDYGFRFGPTFTISQSSLQPNINNNGTGFKADGNFTIYLPGKFQIGSYSDYEFDGKTESFNNTLSKVNLNGFIAKTFLKSDNLKLELWGNDLLNQNVGFSRTATASTIVQNNYTTIKRYFMFTLSYDFTKMAGGSPKK
ncbi:outer membrane beta-barrel protein [Mucilaginibacter sp.]|uniref:outer membrane beta-barrel protein n=1 Tax=Mucilaginibacter sp. TaxID=1882438 RepID=UPI003D0F4228